MANILVTVSGPIGIGKSAVAGEIEIAMRAIGLEVRFSNPGEARQEKNMTGANWDEQLAELKPTITIAEKVTA